MLNHKNTKIMDASIEKRIIEKIEKVRATSLVYNNLVFYHLLKIENHVIVYFKDIKHDKDVMIIEMNEYLIPSIVKDFFSTKEIAEAILHQYYWYN